MVIHHGARWGRGRSASRIAEIYVSADADTDYPFGWTRPIVKNKSYENERKGEEEEDERERNETTTYTRTTGVGEHGTRLPPPPGTKTTATELNYFLSFILFN